MNAQVPSTNTENKKETEPTGYPEFPTFLLTINKRK